MTKSAPIRVKWAESPGVLICVRQDHTLYQIWSVVPALGATDEWVAWSHCLGATREVAAQVWANLLRDWADASEIPAALAHVAQDFEGILLGGLDYSPTNQICAEYDSGTPGKNLVVRAIQPRKQGAWYIFGHEFYHGKECRIFQVAGNIKSARRAAMWPSGLYVFRYPQISPLSITSQLKSMDEKVAPANKFSEKFGRRYFYHFTDARNIESIRAAGGLLSMREMTRRGMRPVAPGGSEASQASDCANGMDAYVHLCFLDKNPMEFRAKEDGRIQKSVFLEIDPGVIDSPEVLFSPGFSNQKGIAFLSFEEAMESMDFEILYREVDRENPEEQQRFLNSWKYEILVPEFIPARLIRNL